jgi:hypothetical protein
MVGDADQQTRLCISLADRLELPGTFLRASRRFLERERELRETIGREQQKARQRDGQDLDRLVRGTTPPSVPVILASLHETEPWLSVDASPIGDGVMPAPAVAKLQRAARICRGHAHAAAVADGTGMYQELQRMAADCVKATAAAKAFPKKLWGAPDPVAEAMREGHEATWATLVRAQDRFALVHQLGALIRSMGSLGASALLPDGAPAWGFVHRQWAKAMEGEQELKRLHPALRLRWAVDHGWEPGLWLAEDLVQPEPEPSLVHRVTGWLINSPLDGPTKPVQVGR